MVSNNHASLARGGPESIPKEHWNRPLSRPLLVVHGRTLHTLSDVRARILALSPQQRACLAWRHVTVLLVAAARAEIADADQLTIAVEMALRLEGRLDSPPMSPHSL